MGVLGTVLEGQLAARPEDEVTAQLPEVPLPWDPRPASKGRADGLQDVGGEEKAQRAKAAHPKCEIALPSFVRQPEEGVSERDREPGHLFRRGEGDHGDLAASRCDLRAVFSQLREMLLAEQSTEVAKDDQDGWFPQQGGGGKRLTINVLHREFKV